MGNPVQQAPRGKVWVEAEESSPGGPAVLTLADVRDRRKAMNAYGEHNVTVPVTGLKRMGFPQRFLDDLREGRPVRFQMFSSAYNALLSRGKGRFSELDGLEGGERTVPEPGDRIEIIAPDQRRRDGSTVRVVGIVDSAIDNGRGVVGGRPDWYIQYTIQPSGGPGYWKQRLDGGTFRVLQKASGDPRPPPPRYRPGLGGVGEWGEKPTYRWIITKDHLDDGDRSDKGVEGPRGADSSLKTNRAHFVMKDDDGITYYEGEIYGDYDGFEPLDDFGTPNAGAVSIWYKGEML